MVGDQDMEQEKEERLMRSYYSGRVSRIQELAERECDRMEYDGSMMFDEYPDRFLMEHLCLKIEKELKQGDSRERRQEEKRTEENSEMTRVMEREDREELLDLIRVILYHEMFRRRSRRRRYRRNQYFPNNF